jgi:hypothetical protein
MSLYGDGRRDGLVAAMGIVVIGLAARAAGALLAPSSDLLAALAPAALPTLGGVLCYRMVRALGLSRYAGFLAGAAYALSPWLSALAARPNEQFAAAFAPLALEAAWRCRKPATRAVWLRWSWLCLSAPWLAGPGVIATCATAVAVGQLLRLARQRDLDGERLAAARIAPPLALTAAAVAAVAALPATAVWPLTAGEPPAREWLAALGWPAARGLDLTALLRAPGAALVGLALLGLLRRQRRVGAAAWVALTVLGALPTALGLAARGLAMDPELFVRSIAADPWHIAAVSWLLLIGCAVLAAAGLDDVLEAPHRHAAARRWLLVGGIAAAALLPGLGPAALPREWPLVAGLLAPSLLLPAWRPLGMPRLKAVLASTVIGTLAVPSLHGEPHRPPPLAAPAGETRPHAVDPTTSPAPAIGALAPAQRAAETALAALRWHYVAASLWLALGGLGVALSVARRRRHVSQPPTPANAAIAKNAPPATAS